MFTSRVDGFSQTLTEGSMDHMGSKDPELFGPGASGHESQFLWQSVFHHWKKMHDIVKLKTGRFYFDPEFQIHDHLGMMLWAVVRLFLIAGSMSWRKLLNCGALKESEKRKNRWSRSSILFKAFPNKLTPFHEPLHPLKVHAHPYSTQPSTYGNSVGQLRSKLSLYTILRFLV